MYDTLGRVQELAAKRKLSVQELAQNSGIGRSTIENCKLRGTQLSLSTVERLCEGLNCSLAEFFADAG